MTRRTENHILYLLIGSLYVFSINASILAASVLTVSPLSLFMVGLGMLLLFMLVFWNRWTILGTMAFILLVAAVIFRMRDRMEEQWLFINEMALLIQNPDIFREELLWPTVLVLCLLTALFTAVCLYVHFHFYLLAGFGASIFIVSWIMDYPRPLSGFVIFLFCFCVLLVRKLQGVENKGKGENRAALIAMPACAVLVFFSVTSPIPNPIAQNTAFTRFMDSPIEAISDFFFLTFNPRYFSFQTTGFANAGGRLGGPVSPNNRPVMSVDAHRRVYLSGITHNIYTGYGWTTDAPEFFLLDEVGNPVDIEVLETARALFWATTQLERLDNDNFQIASYMPLRDVTVVIGNNRTGSLFRPPRGLDLVFGDSSLLNNLMVNASGDMRMAELLPRDTVYRFSFLDLDYRNPGVNDVLMQSRRGLYRQWADGLRFHHPLYGDSHRGMAFIAQNPLYFLDIVDEYEEEIGSVLLEFDENSRQYVMEFREYTRHFILSAFGITRYDEMIISVSSTRHRIPQEFLRAVAGTTIGLDWLIADYSISPQGRATKPAQRINSIDNSTAMWIANMAAVLNQYEWLAQYADFVYQHYLALPDTLPERVIQLAHDITADYDTDYERIRALQAYLIQFPYTLSPVAVPRDRDFVDFFLHDGQEGYCVYYASAMAVMSRAIGIPARYVEGFLLPPERDPDTGLFNVTNRNAHAWVEVYFEGFGWLIVETTAPYVTALYDTPATGSSSSYELFGDMDWFDEEHYMLMQMLMQQGQGGTFVPTWDGMTPMQGVQGIEENPVRWWEIALRILAVVSAGMAAFLIIQKVIRLVRRNRLQKLDSNNRAIYYYQGLLKMTTYWNYPIQEGETPHVYGQRLRYRFGFANDTVFLQDLNKIYYKARYGAEPLGEREADLMKNCYYEMLSFLKRMRFGPQFLYLRYVKGVIAL